MREELDCSEEALGATIPLLNVKVISGLLLKGRTGPRLGASVRVRPDITPEQHEEEILKRTSGWRQRPCPSDFERIFF